MRFIKKLILISLTVISIHLNGSTTNTTQSDATNQNLGVAHNLLLVTRSTIIFVKSTDTGPDDNSAT